jgi:uncharacterized membrane-anchored protein YhcB (DUF1043 family)
MHTAHKTNDGVVVKVLILLGLLIGLVIGAGACARYLRQEMAANIGPRLRHIEMQLDIMRAEMNLAAEARLAALNRRFDEDQLNS